MKKYIPALLLGPISVGIPFYLESYGVGIGILVAWAAVSGFVLGIMAKD